MINTAFPSAPRAWLGWYVTILVVLLALTGLLDIFQPDEVPERAINLHHIWAVLGLFIFLTHGRLVIPHGSFALFFAAALVISLLADIEFGFNLALANVVYCFYLLLLGLALTQIMPPDLLSRALGRAAIIILTAITIKNVFFFGRIMDTLATLQGRVFIPTVVAGGTNVEATFAVFAAALLHGRRLYWPAFLYALFLSILYSSRAGLLGAAVLFMFEFFIAPKEQRNLLFRQIRIALLALVALGAVITLFATPIAQFALQRFEDVGYEPGSEGRIAMWQAAPQVFLLHPFGVGAGNAIAQVSSLLGVALNEDNMHNIMLQILLDLGIFGFFAYLIMWAQIWRRAWVAKMAHSLWLVIALYFLLGFLQFRAYDPFAFLCLGLVWHARRETAAA